MNEQPSNVTRLEWITCPFCSQTFQVAVPAKATDIRIRQYSANYDLYRLSVKCISPQCNRDFIVETNLADKL